MAGKTLPPEIPSPGLFNHILDNSIGSRGKDPNKGLLDCLKTSNLHHRTLL